MSVSSTRAKGIGLKTSLIGLGAGVVWSLGALFGRLADQTSTWQYLFYRSLAVFLVIEVGAHLRGRGSMVKRAFTEGRLMLASTLSLLLASIGFVYAVKNTSAANAAFLGSLSPLMAAILGFVVFRERISRVTVLAIVVSVAGLLIMAFEDTGGSNFRGNVGALSSSFGFACYTLCLRRDRTRNWDPVMPGYAVIMMVLCATIATAQHATLLPPIRDVTYAMIHGGILITVGTLMYNYASRSIPAVAMTVFAQTEMVFVPIWIFLFMGEQPSARSLLGGAMILCAVIGKAVFDVDTTDASTRTQPHQADLHQPPQPA